MWVKDWDDLDDISSAVWMVLADKFIKKTTTNKPQRQQSIHLTYSVGIIHSDIGVGTLESHKYSNSTLKEEKTCSSCDV